MTMEPAVIWHTRPNRLRDRLWRAVDQGLADCAAASPAVFFRADDIGVPGRHFARLASLFARHRTPLSLAVVPAWLTPERWHALRTAAPGGRDLWCWHQHGWRHVSHAVSGKKQEFGSRRGGDRIARDLRLGKARLTAVMEDDFFPGFTPPWNRCGPEALQQLREQGFRFISRSRGALPPPPEGLPDFPVNVDLHTRKETLPENGWERLFSEIRDGIAGGCCGVMIHHQRMNDAAFDFLGMMLSKISGVARLKRVHLGHLAEARGYGYGIRPVGGSLS